MKAHKTFLWFAGVTFLVTAAMFVAEVPAIIAGPFSYWGMWVAFIEAEAAKHQGGE